MISFHQPVSSFALVVDTGLVTREWKFSKLWRKLWTTNNKIISSAFVRWISQKFSPHITRVIISIRNWKMSREVRNYSHYECTYARTYVRSSKFVFFYCQRWIVVRYPNSTYLIGCRTVLDEKVVRTYGSECVKNQNEKAKKILGTNSISVPYYDTL